MSHLSHFLSAQVTDTKYIHVVVRPSPPSTSRTPPSRRAGTLLRRNTQHRSPLSSRRPLSSLRPEPSHPGSLPGARSLRVPVSVQSPATLGSSQGRDRTRWAGFPEQNSPSVHLGRSAGRSSLPVSETKELFSVTADTQRCIRFRHTA